MKLSGSPSVVRVWLPTILALWAFLLYHRMPPEYWLIPLPLYLVLAFMSTLADVKDDGNRIRVKRFGISTDVPRGDVVRTSQSFLKGIGTLQLKRFVLPWGKIYFVTDWSKVADLSAESEGEGAAKGSAYQSVCDILWSLAGAVSGFSAARAVTRYGHTLRIQPSTRMAAFALAGTLLVAFAIARKRKPGFANVVLFTAALVIGLVYR
jgi:hypothetical protein